MRHGSPGDHGGGSGGRASRLGNWPRRRGGESAGHRLCGISAGAGDADPRRGGGEDRRLHELPHRDRFAHDAHERRRQSRLHRLPRRRCRRDALQCRGAGERSISQPRGTGACPAALSRDMALAVLRQARGKLHAPQSRGAGIHPLRESERLSRRARGVRRVPSRHHPGGRALADGDGGAFLGRGVLQQRHRPVQAFDPRRGLYARRQAREPYGAREADAGDDARPWHHRADLSAAGVGGLSSRRHLPGVRARRPQHQQHLRRGRIAGFERRAAAHRGAGPARSPSIEPRSRHGPARVDPGPQHHQDPPQRPVHLVHGHERQPGRLPQFRLRVMPRRLCQQPRRSRPRGLMPSTAIAA